MASNPVIAVIAVIDDDKIVRTSVGSLVRSSGYSAAIFASAEEFLAADITQFACLVSDVQMPGLSGLDLQRIVAERAPELSVILMTAFPDDRVRARAQAAGVHGFFEKPCDPDALIACIHQAVSGPQS